MKKGRLEVVCGSMFSGKTEELMRRLKRAEFARKSVVTIKHEIDNRGSYSCILSHSGSKREAHPVTSCEEGLKKLIELADEEVDVIGIDEIQFFPRKTVPIIDLLVSEGKRVILAGLDLDFKGEPFGIVPDLMAMADEVQKLRAICVVCGTDANHTQRLIDGREANYEDPLILVGGNECYEPRCRSCYKINKKCDLLASASH